MTATKAAASRTATKAAMIDLSKGNMNKTELFHKVDKLSKAEKRVFLELLKVKSHAEIADSLCISLKGVTFHLSSIYKKLEIEGCTKGTPTKQIALLRECLDFTVKIECGLQNIEGLAISKRTA